MNKRTHRTRSIFLSPFHSTTPSFSIAFYCIRKYQLERKLLEVEERAWINKFA